MSNPRHDDHAYEPPAVEDREPIDTPLVAVTSCEPASAAFHPFDDEAAEYEAPAIDDRERIETALIGAIGSDEPQLSAAFHPADPADAYEPESSPRGLCHEASLDRRPARDERVLRGEGPAVAVE